MSRVQLELQPEIAGVDEATTALLDEARASILRGEVFTPEQTRAYARENYEARARKQEKDPPSSNG